MSTFTVGTLCFYTIKPLNTEFLHCGVTALQDLSTTFTSDEIWSIGERADWTYFKMKISPINSKLRSHPCVLLIGESQWFSQP